MVEEICFLRMEKDTMDNSMRINFRVLGFLFGLMEGDIRGLGKMGYNKETEFIESFQELF
jgi:hypothetical protein